MKQILIRSVYLGIGMIYFYFFLEGLFSASISGDIKHIYSILAMCVCSIIISLVEHKVT